MIVKDSQSRRHALHPVEAAIQKRTRIAISSKESKKREEKRDKVFLLHKVSAYLVQRRTTHIRQTDAASVSRNRHGPRFYPRDAGGC